MTALFDPQRHEPLIEESWDEEKEFFGKGKLFYAIAV